MKSRRPVNSDVRRLLEMKVILAIIFVGASVLYVGVGTAKHYASPQEQLQLKPIPGDTPQPLFASTILDRSKQADILPLNEKKLANDAFEFRVWVGFGKKPLEGFVITRTGNDWHGMFLESINATTRPPYKRDSIKPKSGWSRLWDRLIAERLLSLPDFSTLKNEETVFDGTSYVVELKDFHTYRTYTYMNPDYQRWPEAKRMCKIADILYSEFDLRR